MQIIKIPKTLLILLRTTNPVKGGVGSELNGVVFSDPPTGKFKVTNLYVEPTTGKLVVKYDDTPQE